MSLPREAVLLLAGGVVGVLTNEYYGKTKARRVIQQGVSSFSCIVLTSEYMAACRERRRPVS